MTVWGAIPVKKTISSRGGCKLALQPQAQGVMWACLIPINSNLLLLHPQPAASLSWAEMPVVLWEQGKLPGWGSCPSLCRPCCRSTSPATCTASCSPPQSLAIFLFLQVVPAVAGIAGPGAALLQLRAWVIPGGTDPGAMKSVCSLWELS